MADYPEVRALLERLNGGDADDVITLFLPTVNRWGEQLFVAKAWRERALRIFAELFGGATVFPGLMGIWRDGDGKDHRDCCEMVESLVAREKLTEEGLYRFVDFCRDMGEKLEQMVVLATFNGRAIWVEIKHQDAD